MSLTKLQEIRERRLDKQRTAVQRAKDIMIAAESKVEQCRQSLSQFHDWRLGHQESLFKSLQGNSSTPQGMFEYRAKIEKLAQEEVELQELIVQAGEELKVTQIQFTEAQKIASQLAMKNEKTKEIIEIQEKAELALLGVKDD